MCFLRFKNHGISKKEGSLLIINLQVQVLSFRESTIFLSNPILLESQMNKSLLSFKEKLKKKVKPFCMVINQPFLKRMVVKLCETRKPNQAD